MSENIELSAISATSHQPLQQTLDSAGDNNSNSSFSATDDDSDSDGDDCGIRSEAIRLIDLVDQRQHHHHRKQTGINHNKNPRPLIHRAKFELSWNCPYFSLLENDDDDNGNQEEYQSCVVLIDVQQSFAPASPIALLFRCVWLVASLLIEFLSFHVRYLSYLTNISLIMTIMYQLTSCGMSLYAADFISGLGGVMERRRKLFGDQQLQPGYIVRFVWIVYTVALVAEFVVMCAYWISFYDGKGLQFHSLYVHLFIVFILLFDGNVVGRIPLRCKHILWFYVYAALYLLWTIICAYWNLGKNHDVLIYSVMDWKNNPKLAIIIVIVVAFIAGPLSFFVCWLCSLWSKGCTFDGGRRVYKEVYMPDDTASIDEQVVLLTTIA